MKNMTYIGQEHIGFTRGKKYDLSFWCISCGRTIVKVTNDNNREWLLEDKSFKIGQLPE